MRAFFEIEEDARGSSQTVVDSLGQWFEKDFGEDRNYPNALLVGHGLVHRTDYGRALREWADKNMVVVVEGPAKQPEWEVCGLWFDGQHQRVREQVEELQRLRAHIEQMQKIWQEAERIKRVHDGEAALTLSVLVPKSVVTIHVVNQEEVKLDEPVLSALLARVGNEHTEMRVDLRVRAPVLHGGYNHALMESLHMVSGPLSEKIADAVGQMVRKMVEKTNADRDARPDTPVA